MMAYYGRDIDGPMKHTFIETWILKGSEIDIITEKSNQHSKKINEFNEQHNVWFTQETKEYSYGGDRCLRTQILYTPLKGLPPL